MPGGASSLMALSSLLRGQRSQEHELGWGNRQWGGGSGVLGKGGNNGITVGVGALAVKG